MSQPGWCLLPSFFGINLNYKFVSNSPTTSNYSRPSSPVHIPKLPGLWSDIRTMRWMRVPSSSFKMIVYLVIMYLNFAFLQWLGLVSQDLQNPFRSLMLISHRVPSSTDDEPYYQKGPLDLVFIAFYVIVWSFVRQFLTLHFFPPFAKYYGIRKQAKMERFGEQGYALLYFLFMSIYGFVRLLFLNSEFENLCIDSPFISQGCYVWF